MTLYEWWCSHFSEFCSTWGEWHSVVYGFLLMFMPWCWFNMDECYVPKNYPATVRNDIYNEFHYYLFGIVCAIITIVILILIFIKIY